jgi:hypothetical protein|tara:strand:+ start:1029 stop:1598 length:570 start_codon:yes stop_codon:yes gene_type:complete
MNYYKQKQLLLALFITVLLMTTSLFTFGQTTINPDTVCLNATGEQYLVAVTPTSTYQWTITGGGGILQTGQTTNSITVDWGGVSGLYANAVEVIESNAAGCPGAPQLLDVFILDLSGNPLGPFCPGDPTTPLVGSPAGGSWSGTGVVGNNFQPSTGVGNYVLTYSMAGCNTTINVTVNNGPITGPIQHF